MTKSSRCRILTRVLRHCLLLLRISSSFQYVDKCINCRIGSSIWFQLSYDEVERRMSATV
ncbi:hypothetical protein KC19_2G180300 [Ceratodon purpureus]|uniref:Uncharacterized protein n=1 Tax=Ceratodon purpureus TaxID=3225 RepID=A0A8T0IY26_CERPU|nr:hypothetical protein KC19_2G180300 [Ceratodon purpureus]